MMCDIHSVTFVQSMRMEKKYFAELQRDIAGQFTKIDLNASTLKEYRHFGQCFFFVVRL